MIGSVTDKLKLIILLTYGISFIGCVPNPSKVKKIVELTEHQKFQDKYELVFKKCSDLKNTDLTFVGLSEKPTITIYLDLKPESENTDWQELLLCFQKKLPEMGLKYQAIVISDGRGPDFQYSPKCVERYNKAFRLFNQNLKQIKENRIDDLFTTMNYTRVKIESIIELFNYIKVNNLENAELVAYPSDEIFGDDRTVFKLETSKNTILYFSYVMRKEHVYLTSIDLNNIPNSINISDFLGKIKK
nr:hypothetical protein [uncultured Fluviicola sp.]